VLKNLDPQNVKALFRRAYALKSLKRHEEAIDDLDSLLKINPKNEAGQNLLQECLKIVPRKEKPAQPAQQKAEPRV